VVIYILWKTRHARSPGGRAEETRGGKMRLKTGLGRVIPLMLLLGALTLGACKGGSGGPLEPEEALLRMVLTPEDVGEPYVEDSARTTTNEDLAPEELTRAEELGRILGYSVAISRGDADEVEFPIFGVESAASLYEGSDGASESLADDVQEARDTDWGAVLGFADTEIEEIDRSFAAETFWLRLSAVERLGDDQRPVLIIEDRIILREGRARGFLLIAAALEGSSDRGALMDEVAALAEEQARRMRDNVD
jgi:hypothetical protein